MSNVPAMRAMTATQVVSGLAKLDGWRLCGDGPDIAIEKSFMFDSYAQTMAFVNSLAWFAQARNHHPDLMVQSQRCHVQWRTHDVAGLSQLDFDCAAAVDAFCSAVPECKP